MKKGCFCFRKARNVKKNKFFDAKMSFFPKAQFLEKKKSACGKPPVGAKKNHQNWEKKKKRQKNRENIFFQILSWTWGMNLDTIACLFELVDGL